MTDERRIASYYDDLVNRYGHDPRAVDASSEASLLLRYQALADVGDMTGRSVLEVGCGLGGLGHYLTQRFDDVRYLGIDISPRMVEEGRKAHPGLDLQQRNLLQIDDGDRWDFVLAQGIFYLLGDEAEPQSQRLMAKMFSVAEVAVAFTAISSWSPSHEEAEFYMDPAWTLSYCRTLTARLVLRHDYHPGDMAVYLYKREFN